MKRKDNLWILTADCPSRLGTVDVITRFLAESNNYVGEIQSFDDREVEHFSIRVEFFPLDEGFCPDNFGAEFAPRAAEFDMTWQLTAPHHKPKVAVMVSKYDHCLHDLLYHYSTGELDIEIPNVGGLGLMAILALGVTGLAALYSLAWLILYLVAGEVSLPAGVS